MDVIAFGSGKGGVGRSTITANLGIALAELGKSTLVIDGCLTSPDQALFFNLEKASATLNDVLSENIPVEDAIYNGPGGVRIIPAAVTLDKMRDAEPSRLPKLVKEKINGYDFVLIDTPNGLRLETVSALKAGEKLIVVTMPEVTSISDSLKTKVASEFLGLDPMGLIINQIQEEEYELEEEEIGEIMNLPILAKIPYDEAVPSSLNEGKLLLEKSPNSAASKEIKKLGKRLVERT